MSKNEMKVTQQHELDREMSDICKSAFAKYIHLPFKRGETVNMFMYAINKSFHLDFSRTQIYLHFNTNIFSFSTQIYLLSNTNIFVLTKIHLPFERTQRVNMFMNAINKLETILFGLYRNTLPTKHICKPWQYFSNTINNQLYLSRPARCISHRLNCKLHELFECLEAQIG